MWRIHFLRFLIVIQIALATTSMAEDSTIKILTSSSTGKSTSSTNQEARESASVAWWTRAHFWVTTGVAVLGALTIVSSFRLNDANKRLDAAQSALAMEKDRLAAIDSKNKDLEIQNAKTAASEADARAREADAKGAAAKLEAAEANKQAALAKAEAGNANLAAEELKTKNLETETKLEKEKAVRIKLEQSLKPRRLTMGIGELDGTSDTPFNVKPVAEFSGTKVVFRILSNDAEAMRAASAIAALVIAAKWEIAGYERREELNAPYFDGVSIFIKDRYESPQNSNAKNAQAANALKAFLVRQGIETEIRSAGLGDASSPRFVPENMIVVAVGFKPSPYFDSPEVDEVRRVSEETFKKFAEKFARPPNEPKKDESKK